jgi:hypothetical protein
MLEIVYPFMLVHLWLDFLEWLDRTLGTSFIHAVDEVRAFRGVVCMCVCVYVCVCVCVCEFVLLFLGGGGMLCPCVCIGVCVCATD